MLFLINLPTVQVVLLKGCYVIQMHTFLTYGFACSDVAYLWMNYFGNLHSLSLLLICDYTCIVMLSNTEQLAFTRGTHWCSWLRHCATSRKVMGSIPDGVTGIFQ
jgi:hypothetical protein